MGHLRTFTKETVQYGIGNAIKKFISFLLLPIYTRVLTPADYGVLETIGTTVLIASILFGVRVTDGGSRFYYEVEKEEKGVVLFTVFILNLISIIPSFIIAFFSNKVSILLFKTDEYAWVVFLAAMTIPLTLINDEQSWIYRYERKPWRFNVYIIVRTILNIVFGILLVFHLKKGVLGAQLASLISLLITISFSLISFTSKNYTFKFSFYWAKRIIKFSYPLMLSALIAWIYSSADRYLLLGYKSVSDVGLYSIGATFARPISILNMAIGMSFYPFFMSLYEKENDVSKSITKRTSNKIWYLYLFISLNLALILSTFGKDIIRLVATPEYIAGAIVIPLLIFSQIFRQSIEITSLGMFLKEKTIHYTWLTALTSGVSLFLNFMLIPKLGFHGAAISNMAANLVYFIVAYNLSQKFFFIERKIEIIILYMSIIFIITNIVPILEINYDIDIPLLTKILILIICFIFPFVIKIISIKPLLNFMLEKA